MRTKTILTLALLLFVAPRCASVERQHRRDVVKVDGRYVSAQDRSYGCDGEVVDGENHDQVAGTIVYEHRAVDGFAAGAVAALGRGVVTDSFERVTLGHGESYLLGSVGATVGYDFKYFGGEIGAHVIFSDSDFEALPSATLRAGSIDHVWGELQVGPREGAFDGEIMGLHLAGRNDRFHARLGVGLFARPMLLGDGTLDLGAQDRVFDAGLALEAGFALVDGISLELGGVVSASPSFLLGLSFPVGGSE